MSEYVTAQDLKAWDMLAGTDARPNHGQAKREPKEPRKMPARESKPRVSSPVRLENARQYAKTISQVDAVNKALEIVTVKLGYDLTTATTIATKKARRDGWHTFCLLIKILYKDFTLRGVSDAISVPNAPCREVLGNMFMACREECPHSENELRKLLGV
jgi:hypothetical protein